MMLMSVATFAAEGWPANYGGVMLQAFWWDSYADTKWSALEARSNELSQYFDLIWIPNAATTADHAKVNEMGYMPCYYLDYNTCFGTEAQLRSLIKTYKAKGTGIIEDVVINHKNGFMSWCSFPDEEVVGTNTGKTYSVTWDNTNYTGICKNDEANSNASSGVAGKIQGNYDTGDNFDGCRDLDHTNSLVQQNIKTYLDYMKNEIGFAGWRYDMVKGYSPAYTKIYNESCDAQFSVGEYWASEGETKGWIDGTGKTSAAFDFDLKYNIARAFDEGNWQALGWRSFTGNASYARYSVTFVDNHDTGRTDGHGSKPLANKWSAANAYILAIPGTPCIWLKHWNADKTNIGKMILARKAAGITNQSSVLNEGQKDGGYYIETQGTKGKVYVLFGGAANGSAPSGYTLVASGDAYKFYSTVTADDATVEISPAGTSFKTETLDITLKATNAASAWYHVDGGAKTSFTGTTTVTIGDGVEIGSAITVAWGATDKNGKETTGSATYTKKDPNATTVIYLKNASNWSDVYAYVYSGTTSNGEWPGVKMTKSATADYDYSYTLPDDLADGCKVIFTESQSATTNRYPADGAEGLECDGKSMLFNNSTKAWGEYSTAPEPTPGPGPQPDVVTATVYFDNTANYGTVTCHYWGGVSSEWPGVTTTDKTSEGYYKFTINVTAGMPTGIIFSDNGNNKFNGGIDGEFIDGALYSASGYVRMYSDEPEAPEFEGYRVYYNNTNNWATPYCYAWNATGDNTWPGKKMTKDDTTGYWYADFDFEPTNVIFSNNGASQTADLVFANGHLYQADGSHKEYAKQVVATKPTVAITPAGGTYAASQFVTITTKGAKSATYTIDGNDAVSFTDATSITVSKSCTLTVTATNEIGTTTETVEFTISETPVPSDTYYVYFQTSAGWENVSLYAWNDNNTELNGQWPGTNNGEKISKEGNTYLRFALSEQPTGIIFFNGTDKAGYGDLDFAANGLYNKDGYTGKEYTDTPDVVELKVTISPEGGEFKTSRNITVEAIGAVSSAYQIGDSDPIQFSTRAAFSITETCTVTVTAESATGEKKSVSADFVRTDIPVVKPIPGDVNGDKTIDDADYEAIVDIVLKKTDMPAPGSDDFTRADANEDGSVNAADVMAVENKINNK